MPNTLVALEMDSIYANPLNDRSMDQEEIEIIKESILEVGLLHPLAVYKESADKYILVSGHKRFEALKELGRTGKTTVSCMVVDKPKDMQREAELLARANVHRSSPEQVKKEVELVNSLWNTMDSVRKKKLTEKYREAFIEAYQYDPKYIEDPAAYISNRFRPRIDYINHITGLNVSNRTISTYLKDTLKKENEGIDESRPKKERVITEKTIGKAVDSLLGLIDGFKKTGDEISQAVLDLETALKAASEDIIY